MTDQDRNFTGKSQLTLEIWHPDCWTLQVTEESSAGLLAHTVFNTTNERVKGHFTVYGDTTADIDDFIAATERSSLTHSVAEMQRRHGLGDRNPPGNTSRELFVEYDPDNSMSDALISQDFIQAAPVRVFDGREFWSLFIDDNRDGIQRRLNTIREMTDAEITVTKITRADTTVNGVASRSDELSGRQREVFELARKRNYYSWPREVTTRELADELDISKTTLLEHLRKAEAKLLNSEGPLL